MEHSLVCPKTFRYYTFGDPEKAKFLLFVLHGYGQLAAYFIKKFENLGADYYVVAPEGMHRFYLVGSSGRVGASWMTKEAREQDIHDNLHYLNTLQAEIKKKHVFSKTSLLGFSQGGATAARWNALGEVNADQLILWASVFPPDIKLEIENNKRQERHFVLGTADEYFSEEVQRETLRHYQKKGFETHLFYGTHTIDHDMLISLLPE